MLKLLDEKQIKPAVRAQKEILKVLINIAGFYTGFFARGGKRNCSYSLSIWCA